MERKNVRSGKVSKLRTKLGFERMGDGGRCGYSITMVSLQVTSSHLYLVPKMNIPCIPKGLEDNKSKAIC